MASQGLVEIFLRAQDQASGAIGRVKGALIALTAAVAGAILAAKNLIGAYTEQQVAQTKLITAMKNMGDASDTTIKSLNDQAAALQRLTGISDDEITNAQALLATFGVQADQIKQLIPGILDLASAKASLSGEAADLSGATMAVAKAMEGGLGALARYYGVTTTDAQKRQFELLSTQEKLAFINGILKTKFDGMAEALGSTFQGKVNALTQAFSDMKEIAGELLVRFFSPFVGLALIVVDKFNTLSASTQRWVIGIGLLLGSLGSLVAIISSGMLVWAALGTAITGVATALYVAIVPAALLAAKIVLIAGSAALLGTALYSVIQYARGAESQFSNLGKVITDSFVVPVKIIIDAWKFLFTVINNIVTAIAQSAMNLFDSIKEAARGNFAEAGRLMGSFKDISIEKITGIGAAWDQFTQSFIQRGTEMGTTQTLAFEDMSTVMKNTMASLGGFWAQINNEMANVATKSATATKVAHVSAAQQILNAFKNMNDAQKAQLANWNSFMVSSLQGATGKAKGVYKAFAIGNAIADTYRAANGAYAALSGIPFIGPVLGIAAAAAAVAAGIGNVNKIRALEEGGIIPGSHGGTMVLAGENGRSEAIVPLQSGKGFGGGNTYNFYGPVLDHAKLIEMIDSGLSESARRGRSAFADRLESGN